MKSANNAYDSTLVGFIYGIAASLLEAAGSDTGN